MDTFVDSSWYFLRYCDPHNDTRPVRLARPVDYWNPIDLYIGGVDHATVHMIYARFWMKVLNDLGLHRLPRAVRALLLERLGDARQDEDVEARRKRRRAGRLRRALRRRRLPAEHPLPRPRRTRTWSGPRTSVEAHDAVRPAALARRRTRSSRARRSGPPKAGRSRARRTRRSRRSRTTSAAASPSTRRSRP